MTSALTRDLLDIIYRPLITDKTTRILEGNQYSFLVNINASKYQIKEAIELIFNVNVVKINIINLPIKKKTVGRFIGRKAKQKKAIISLRENESIDLFTE